MRGQDGPKKAQDGLKMVQDGHGSEMARDCPKMAPRWSKMPQECPKMSLRWIKIAQDGPKMANNQQDVGKKTAPKIIGLAECAEPLNSAAPWL